MEEAGKSGTILLTGSTGFVGANLAAYFIGKEIKVIALNRASSDLWRLETIIHNPLLTLLNWEDEDLTQKITALQPETTIHAAWGGVKVNGRDDWDIQMENINLTHRILRLSKLAGVKQFIGCGTWFEYGLCSGRINEAHLANPNSAYSVAKLSAYHVVKQYCTQNNMSWLWLRLFSMIGKYEDEQWITTYTIKSILEHKPVNLTACEQKMDYSNINFICYAIFKITEQKSVSGLFNLGSDQSIRLKNLIESVAEQLSEFDPVIKFGAIPYRDNQVMHIEGDSSAFYNTFELYHNQESISSAISDIIAFYKSGFSRNNYSG